MHRILSRFFNLPKNQFVKIRILMTALLFANNTSALAGGLQVGEMYRTPSGALMIVY